MSGNIWSRKKLQLRVLVTEGGAGLPIKPQRGQDSQLPEMLGRAKYDFLLDIP